MGIDIDSSLTLKPYDRLIFCVEMQKQAMKHVRRHKSATRLHGDLQRRGRKKVFVFRFL